MFEEINRFLPHFSQLSSFIDALASEDICKKKALKLQVNLLERPYVFFHSHALFPTALQTILQDKQYDLMIQTACLKFIGDICAQATYRLEGDSFLLVTVTDEIDNIAHWFASFLGSGEIPRKAYDTRDFDEIDLGDPAAGIDPPVPAKGRLEDFLRDCGYSSAVQGPGAKKSNLSLSLALAVNTRSLSLSNNLPPSSRRYSDLIRRLQSHEAHSLPGTRLLRSTVPQ
jgi:hypothetical protein